MDPREAEIERMRRELSQLQRRCAALELERDCYLERALALAEERKGREREAA